MSSLVMGLFILAMFALGFYIVYALYDQGRTRDE